MALVAATRNMAFTLMRHRVRVNMLNPGWMDTPAEDITQRRYEGATDGWLERAEAVQPMGKLIKPDEIAHDRAPVLAGEWVPDRPGHRLGSDDSRCRRRTPSRTRTR